GSPRRRMTGPSRTSACAVCRIRRLRRTRSATRPTEGGRSLSRMLSWHSPSTTVGRHQDEQDSPVYCQLARGFDDRARAAAALPRSFPPPARCADPAARVLPCDMANRLASQTSLYLQQHAANPVDWYPWVPEALERARREDKPILLSVGYSACHWCHVMAHES